MRICLGVLSSTIDIRARRSRSPGHWVCTRRRKRCWKRPNLFRRAWKTRAKPHVCTPSAVGARTGSISVVDDATGSPHTVTLSGTGQTAPASTGGTPAGSYTIGISGTVGTLSHFGSVILTVQ